MRLAAATIFAVFLLLPSTASASAANGEATLIRNIRVIAQQYDSIARRTLSSPGVELQQIREQYRNYLRDADSSGWHGQPIRELAEIFVLSGGDAAILSPFGEGLEPNSKEKKLFDGIMAYGEGRTSEAEAKLLPLDAASLNPMRGGHLSLAQALLSARLNPKRALGYFETAGLLLPGTLVEEAALRQTTVLAAKTGDSATFSKAAITYLRRFQQSVYEARFEAQIAFHIARFPGAGGVQILNDILNAMPDGWGRCLTCFLTSLAGQAVILGKVDLAISAADTALPLVAEDSADRQRLLLYSGSALIVTDKFPKGLETLRSVENAKLKWEDQELLRASLALAIKLRETPMPLSQLKLGVSAGPSKGNRVFPASGQEDSAKQALTNADAILNKAK